MIFGTGRDKYRSRRNRARVRKLFWQEWNPIGVNSLDGPQDEYDAYADRAYVMLTLEGRSADEIGYYLNWVGSEHMGLGPRQSLQDLAAAVADKLVALRPSFEESNEPF
jgi:hypothetical protein